MAAWRFTRQALHIGLIVAVACFGIGLSVLLASGSRLLSIQSGSMTPALKKGDLISVRKTPTRELRVGDVITYTQPAGSKQTITHRIISIPGDMTGKVITKGDANPTADMSILPSQIVGKVEHHVPYAGYVVDFVRQPIGLALLIYLPALIVIMYEIRRLSLYYRKTQPYIAAGMKHASNDKMSLNIPNSLVFIVAFVGVFTLSTVSVKAALESRVTISSSSIAFAVQKKEVSVPSKPGKFQKSDSEQRQRSQDYPRDGHDNDGHDRYRRR